MIAGNVGELVDLLLRYLDRFAPAAILLADLRTQFFHIIKADGFHGILYLLVNFVARVKELARTVCAPGPRRSPSRSRIRIVPRPNFWPGALTPRCTHRACR